MKLLNTCLALPGCQVKLHVNDKMHMCRTFGKVLHVLVQLADKSEVAASRAQVNPLNMTDLLWSDEFETRATTASGVDPSNWSFQLGDGSAYGLAGASCFIEGSRLRA